MNTRCSFDDLAFIKQVIHGIQTDREALRFFNEDMTSIAKQIVKIDRKLGRA